MAEKMIRLEKARNGSFTCQYKINNEWKYLYSKYHPERSVKEVSINEDTDLIVMLGLGLGYELLNIKEQTSKQIVVIEYDLEFYNIIQSHPALAASEITTCTQLLFGDEYKELNLDKRRIQVFVNDTLFQCNPHFYNSVLKFFFKNNKRENIICMMEHPTILNDCEEAFIDLGYSTKILAWEHKDTLIRKIAKMNPAFLFTINFSEVMALISESLKIPYISWTVDTPAYSLYDLKNLTNTYSIFFVYDEAIVSDLKMKGIKKIYYLPVAANIKRLENLELSEKDYENYTSEISFVGSNGAKNEYKSCIQKQLSLTLQNRVDDLLSQQSFSDTFVLKNIIDEAIVNEIEAESGYPIDNRNHPLLSRKDKLAFLLGRHHSFIERRDIVTEISYKYRMNVYGDEEWIAETESNRKLHYMGYAEHFNEMPKIFRLSKINLNITRAFVETGLPMRVFDVLGSKGFLVTNDKKDINRLFKNGRDLVVYRDLKDLMEIVEYYMINESAREEIIMRGFKTVKANHTYSIRIKIMMDYVYSTLDGFVLE
ncbi:DUF3880 domain-containing protein [Mesobacillus subterraneus]|uniref:CgeB family protein n=1 Tax=Mesobacillus subterraneus TaxID=285983 RepID=UPI00203E13BE|nr:DUF3880 domain-containing protein [Mesobacillus subterraneus]MCM3663585.1 DUF3880 domain-containing protein [Mesobacillus subterraneus]MCM3683351.1 DUF3880 domain-containing protein [Mesobacillus subterraneus]